MKKQCFKCKETKPISEFYAHPKMKDGHLNKCKTCAKRDVAENTELLKNDPHWVHKERARCRLKRKRYRGGPQSAQAQERWRLANKVKCRAQAKARKAVKNGKMPKKTNCEACGLATRLHMHHHDYSKPLEVTWLCPACHGFVHRKPFGYPMP